MANVGYGLPLFQNRLAMEDLNIFANNTMPIDLSGNGFMDRFNLASAYCMNAIIGHVVGRHTSLLEQEQTM